MILIFVSATFVLSGCQEKKRGYKIDINDEKAVMNFLQGKYTYGNNYYNEIHLKIEIVGNKLKYWNHLKGTPWGNEPTCEVNFYLSGVEKDSYHGQPTRDLIFQGDRCLELRALETKCEFEVWYYDNNLDFADFQDGWFEYD